MFLKHPESWVRIQAKRRLAELDTALVLRALQKWVAELEVGPESDHLLYEAMGVYESHDAVNAALLSRLLTSPEPYARAYAARVVGRWADRLPGATPMLEKCISDPHPRVRMEAIAALSHIPSARSVVVAMRALDQAVDLPIRYSLTQSVHALAPYWLPALQRGQLKFDSPTHAAHVFRVYDSAVVASTIRALIESETVTPQVTEDLLVHLASLGTSDEIDFVLRRAESYPGAVGELVKRARRHQLKRDSTQNLILQRMRSSNAVVRAAAIRLVGIAEMVDQSRAVQRIALNSTGSRQERLAAVASLGVLADASSLATLQRLVVMDDSEIKMAAAIALCRRDVLAGAEGIAALIAKSKTQEQIQSLLDPIFERSEGSAALAAAFESIKLDPNVAKRIARELHERGRSDELLQNVLARTLGTDRGKIEYTPQLVRELLVNAKQSGDAKRGAAVFQSEFASCNTCHRVGTTGGTIGPDLTNASRGLSPELIVESILWPNRQIKEGYVATSVLTNDGRAHRGYLVKSSQADTLVLKDPRTHEISYFAAGDVESQQQSLSLMPEGLTRLMTTNELYDLIAYLLDGSSQ